MFHSRRVRTVFGIRYSTNHEDVSSGGVLSSKFNRVRVVVDDTSLFTESRSVLINEKSLLKLFRLVGCLECNKYGSLRIRGNGGKSE